MSAEKMKPIQYDDQATAFLHMVESNYGSTEQLNTQATTSAPAEDLSKFVSISYSAIPTPTASNVAKKQEDDSVAKIKIGYTGFNIPYQDQTPASTQSAKVAKPGIKIAPAMQFKIDIPKNQKPNATPSQPPLTPEPPKPAEPQPVPSKKPIVGEMPHLRPIDADGLIDDESLRPSFLRVSAPAEPKPKLTFNPSVLDVPPTPEANKTATKLDLHSELVDSRDNDSVITYCDDKNGLYVIATGEPGSCSEQGEGYQFVSKYLQRYDELKAISGKDTEVEFHDALQQVIAENPDYMQFGASLVKIYQDGDSIRFLLANNKEDMVSVGLGDSREYVDGIAHNRSVEIPGTNFRIPFGGSVKMIDGENIVELSSGQPGDNQYASITVHTDGDLSGFDRDTVNTILGTSELGLHESTEPPARKAKMLPVQKPQKKNGRKRDRFFGKLDKVSAKPATMLGNFITNTVQSEKKGGYRLRNKLAVGAAIGAAAIFAFQDSFSSGNDWESFKNGEKTHSGEITKSPAAESEEVVTKETKPAKRVRAPKPPSMSDQLKALQANQ